LKDWLNEIKAHAQGSFVTSNRASLVHGLAAPTSYSVERNLMYQPDGYGQGNGQGIDRGGGPIDLTRGTTAAPTGQNQQRSSNDKG